MDSTLARRLTAQLLTGPPADRVTDVVGRLLAVQAQDPRGARLALRPRSTGLHASDLDRALTADRSVLISTLHRGTLHLVRTEDYWWLRPLTTPQLETGSARRLAQEQVPPAAAERALAIVERELSTHGPLTRAELREPLAAAGVRVAGQALPHIFFRAAIRGLVVRGPMRGAEQCFVLVRDWLGRPPPPLDPDTARAELARRYLAGHGPAGPADLTRWAGIPLGAARRGFADLGRALAVRDDGLAELADRAESADEPAPPPRLLGAFDPVLHGWTSRAPIVGSHRGIVTSNGIFRPFAMVGGRAVATWTLPGGAVELAPLEPIPAAARRALTAEAAAVRAYLAG